MLAAETADTALTSLTCSCLEDSGDANRANWGRIQPRAFTLQPGDRRNRM